jgi:hypothetical protein
MNETSANFKQQRLYRESKPVIEVSQLLVLFPIFSCVHISNMSFFKETNDRFLIQCFTNNTVYKYSIYTTTTTNPSVYSYSFRVEFELLRDPLIYIIHDSYMFHEHSAHLWQMPHFHPFYLSFNHTLYVHQATMKRSRDNTNNNSVCSQFKRFVEQDEDNQSIDPNPFL